MARHGLTSGSKHGVLGCCLRVELRFARHGLVHDSECSPRDSPSDTDPDDPDGGLDNASAYGYPCLSDGKWIYDQRVGQFSTDTRNATGGTLTYNGYTLPSIDESCADSYLPSTLGTESRSCHDVV